MGTYVPSSKAPLDYAQVRASVRAQLLKGVFGPSSGGVYSASLQATIYDAGCMVLSAAPQVAAISIDTPNLHYIPAKFLSSLGDGRMIFEDDVFVPTSDPSGSIHCTVSR